MNSSNSHKTMHIFTPIFVAGIVAGIALTILYQNVTGMQAGGVMAYREAPTDAALPQVAGAAELPASTPIRLVTVPGLPVLPTPTTPIRSVEADLPISVPGIKNPNPAAEEKQSDKDDSTGVHVEIRSKTITQLTNPTQAALVTVPNLEKATPTKEAIKDQGPSLPANVTPEKKAEEVSVIREQADGAFVRVGNQVRFVPKGVGLRTE